LFKHGRLLGEKNTPPHRWGMGRVLKEEKSNYHRRKEEDSPVDEISVEILRYFGRYLVDYCDNFNKKVQNID
jgi:hypothetical protein